jgi:hypothetical protein
MAEFLDCITKVIVLAYFGSGTQDEQLIGEKIDLALCPM